MEIRCPRNCVENYVHVADNNNGIYSINSSVCAAAYQEEITGTHGRYTPHIRTVS